MNVTNKAASRVGWVPSDKTYFIFERMHAVLPYPYWAWKVTFIAVFAVLSAVIAKQLIKRRLVSLDQNQKLEWYRQRSFWSDRKFQSYVMCFCASFIRFLWFLDRKFIEFSHHHVTNLTLTNACQHIGKVRRGPICMCRTTTLSHIISWTAS